MKTMQPAPVVVESNSIEETEAIGRRLAQALTSNLVLALKGNLGAGKTTLTRGIVAGLGIEARVTSPTFTLINEYTDKAAPHRLLHMDSYRLGEDPQVATAEVETLGLDELLDDVEAGGDQGLTVLVIEWAERLASLLPKDHLEVRLDQGDLSTSDLNSDRRTLTLTAHGVHSAAVLEAFAMIQPLYFRAR
jgi:tRNA threonylcarbamoyladenosine biosynthesis protein TsaE